MKHRRVVVFAAACLFTQPMAVVTANAAADAQQADFGQADSGEANSGQTDAASFRAIYEKEWAFRLKEFPLLATAAGEDEFDDALGHVSESDQLRRHEYWQGIRGELKAISCERLERADCINLRLFTKQIDDFLADYETRAYLIPFNSDGDFTWTGRACPPIPNSAIFAITKPTSHESSGLAR